MLNISFTIVLTNKLKTNKMKNKKSTTPNLTHTLNGFNHSLIRKQRLFILGIVLFEFMLAAQIYFGFGFDPITYALMGFNFSTFISSCGTFRSMLESQKQYTVDLRGRIYPNLKNN